MSITGDFAQTWIDAWNSHDVGSVMALYAPGGSHRMSSGPERVGDELLAMVERSMAAYPDLSFELRDSFWSVTHGSGARIVIEYVMRGTQTGAINGREGTGRPIEIDAALVATLDAEGRLLAVIDYIDHHAIRVQQGTAV